MNKRLGILVTALTLLAAVNVGGATIPQPVPCQVGPKQCVPAPSPCGAVGQHPCPRQTPPPK
jgi:hypothetical protein